MDISCAVANCDRQANGRLSFHPIPCGAALFGYVTSGATCSLQQSSGIGHTGDRVTLARIL